MSHMPMSIKGDGYRFFLNYYTEKCDYIRVYLFNYINLFNRLQKEGVSQFVCMIFFYNYCYLYKSGLH